MNILHEPGRLWMESEDELLLAEVLYPQAADGLVEITHTFVDDSLRGQGIAGNLMKAVAEELRAEKKKAVPVCSYAQAWFRRHPEYADVVR